MLAHIPCHLIAGPLGAGKTSLIRRLLAQKPTDERWAVLVNEFGRIGLDAALLGGEQDDIAVAEVAGGCLCCLNGVPFQVGLGRLLRRARPQRLFIEPSGLGHPLTLLEQLSAAPWQEVLAPQPLVMVLDAAALARGEPLPEAQRQALQHAELVLLNHAEALDDTSRAALRQRFAGRPLRFTEQAALPLEDLPGYGPGAAVESENMDLPSLPWLALPPGTATGEPQIQAQGDGWAIGWQWSVSERFARDALLDWLGQLPWRRCKALIQADDGAWALNLKTGQPRQWQSARWSQDSRLELIFDRAQDWAALDQTLRRYHQTRR